MSPKSQMQLYVYSLSRPPMRQVGLWVQLLLELAGLESASWEAGRVVGWGEAHCSTATSGEGMDWEEGGAPSGSSRTQGC